jgi:hypothetical protein
MNQIETLDQTRARFGIYQRWKRKVGAVLLDEKIPKTLRGQLSIP